MLYIRLFQGREDPNQAMDEWGSDGPVFGPYEYVHTTYASMIRLYYEDSSYDELSVYSDVLYYDGIYYGDWTVFDDSVFNNTGYHTTRFEQEKANLPG